jgi:hypothetical protein
MRAKNSLAQSGGQPRQRSPFYYSQPPGGGLGILTGGHASRRLGWIGDAIAGQLRSVHPAAPTGAVLALPVVLYALRIGTVLALMVVGWSIARLASTPT